MDSGPDRDGGREWKDRDDSSSIPSWGGSLGSWRDYKRRVAVWIESCAGKSDRQAARLMSKPSREAWSACETLDLADLRVDNGVSLLLSHLEKSLALSATHQQGESLEEMMFGIRRQGAEGIQTFVSRLSQQGIDLPDEAMGFLYLKRVCERSSNSVELKNQILTLAGGRYALEELARALATLLFTEQASGSRRSFAAPAAPPQRSSNYFQRRFTRQSSHMKRRSCATEAGEEDELSEDASSESQEDDVVIEATRRQ